LKNRLDMITTFGKIYKRSELMNRIQPVMCEAVECSVVNDQALIAERHIEMLGDESKLRAEQIESIYFPGSVQELCWALQDLQSKNATCVISAGRTGIAGGAAPIGTSSVVSLNRLNRPLGIGKDGDEYYIRVEPGFSLAMLTGLLMKKDFSRLTGCSDREREEAQKIMADDDLQFWFPVNPTETSAHIGGIVATNASGARSYRWGATREWVRALKVVLPDGRLLALRRGEVLAENGKFAFEQSDGTETEIQIPDVVIPSTKATLGYPLQSDMDLIDLFIGSEGTLGVIVEVELRLDLRPTSVIGVLVIVPDENTALNLVELARSDSAIRFDAIEYFDSSAFKLLQEKKQMDGAGSHIPDLPNWNGCGVYLEFSGTEDETEDACVPLEEILEKVGLSLDDTWAAMTSAEMAGQRVFRHAVPEAVNAIIGQRKAKYPQLHKVGTDMAVPDTSLRELFAMYRQDLLESGIDSVVFGHIGDNHVHVNLLPKNMEELGRAKDMYLGWAAKVTAMGGAVAAEHGIGRMKKNMLAIQYSSEVLQQMFIVRQLFDPQGLLAPGVLFDKVSR
jgi:D-lactate dehydrogenase (cytochrome)